MNLTRNLIDAIIVAMFSLTLLVGYSFPKFVELGIMEFSTAIIIIGLIVVFAAAVSNEAADGDMVATCVGAGYTIVGMFIGLWMTLLIFIDFLLACLGLLVVFAYVVKGVKH